MTDDASDDAPATRRFNTISSLFLEWTLGKPRGEKGLDLAPSPRVWIVAQSRPWARGRRDRSPGTGDRRVNRSVVPNIGPIVREESPAVLLLHPPTVLQRPLPVPGMPGDPAEAWPARIHCDHSVALR